MRVGQLQQDCERIREEREALLNQVLELQAINAELGVNLRQANLAIDICLTQIRAPPGTPITLDESILALVTSVGRHPVHSPQVSSQTRLTALLDPLPSALDTPTSQLTPILATPTGRPPLEPPLQSTPTLLHMATRASSNLAAPPRQESDREEDMDSEPQQGPESQQ